MRVHIELEDSMVRSHAIKIPETLYGQKTATE